MKAQITEAHRDLVLRVRVCDIHYGIEPAAQLIADSEAAAVEKCTRLSADFYADMERALGDDRNTSYPVVADIAKIRSERDQLRAQVALDEKAKALMLKEHFRDVDEIARLRAEVARLREVNADFDRAVAEVADFKANGCSIKESVRLRAEVERLRAESAVDRDLHRSAATRADRAEAELAKERARLDWMDNYGYENGANVKEWAIALPENQKSNTRNLRAAIDAAVNESK